MRYIFMVFHYLNFFLHNTLKFMIIECILFIYRSIFIPYSWCVLSSFITKALKINYLIKKWTCFLALILFWSSFWDIKQWAVFSIGTLSLFPSLYHSTKKLIKQPDLTPTPISLIQQKKKKNTPISLEPERMNLGWELG